MMINMVLDIEVRAHRSHPSVNSFLKKKPKQFKYKLCLRIILMCMSSLETVYECVPHCLKFTKKETNNPTKYFKL